MSVEVSNVLPSDLLTRFMVILMVTAVSSTMVPQLPIFQVYASNSAYDSGDDHGCDDAGISNPSDRYINQPEKGPSFHTGEFMQGYNAGFNSCSGGAGFQESRPFSSDDRNGNRNENVKSEGNGAEDGTNEARSDFLNTNGRGKDPSCSPYEHTDAYCTAFKFAYEVQWGMISERLDVSSNQIWKISIPLDNLDIVKVLTSNLNTSTIRH